MVVLDEEGRPSFQRLQRRAQQRRTTDIQRSALELPATYYAFDLLGFEGFDVRPLPLVERKRLLQLVLPRAGPVRFLDDVPEQGEAFYAEVSRLRLEGLIAKRADAPYRAGRSPHWLKLRTERADDFVVVGFTQPQGARTGFGALHLAAFEGEALVYCGRAGSGFGEEQLVALREALDARAARVAGLRRPAADRPRPRLGRAAARGRGALPDLDRRGSPPPAGLPAPARRQAPGRVPDARRPEGRRRGPCRSGVCHSEELRLAGRRGIRSLRAGGPLVARPGWSSSG